MCLGWQIAAFLLTRLIVSTSNRMVYPFLPAIAAGDAFGAFIGPLFFRSGILANVAVTASLNGTGLLLLVLFVRIRYPDGDAHFTISVETVGNGEVS